MSQITHRVDQNEGLVGQRVEAGSGKDYDTGWVVRVDGDTAIVAWDTGVRTPCPVADLTILDAALKP